MWHESFNVNAKTSSPAPSLPRTPAPMSTLVKNIIGTVFLALVALALGLYVFPAQPWLAWGLLFLCWACFRLSLRAQRIFGPRRPAGGAETATVAESGSKGGRVDGGGIAADGAGTRDRMLARYAAWRGNGAAATDLPDAGRDA
jgi:hypothetical protein